MAKLTKKSVWDALKKMEGNISAAARLLKVTRHAIHYHIAADPKLQEFVSDCRETMCDDAEAGLGAAIIDREQWAILHMLSTPIGKARGLAKESSMELTGKNGKPMELTATVIDARAKILSFAEEFREAALQNLAEAEMRNGHTNGDGDEQPADGENA